MTRREELLALALRVEAMALIHTKATQELTQAETLSSFYQFQIEQAAHHFTVASALRALAEQEEG